MTGREIRLWQALRLLRPQGLHFRRQAPIAAYVLDFACLRACLVIKIDGGQHGTDAHQVRDRDRDAALGALG